jgi:hypothetical protein
MEAPAAFRRRMGVAKVASRPWRLHIRGGPLGLTTLGLEKGIAAANMLSSCSLQAAVNYSLMQQWVWRAGAIPKNGPAQLPAHYWRTGSTVIVTLLLLNNLPSAPVAWIWTGTESPGTVAAGTRT